MRYKLWPFKQNYLATMFFKVIHYGYETFEKIIWVNTTSITNKRLL